MGKREMALHAYSSVLIYMRSLELGNLSIEELSNCEWEDIPFITKEQFLKEDCESGISNEYIKDFLGGKLLCSPTSGSTGKCMNIFWSNDTYNDSLMELWILRKKRYGINPLDKMCYFYSTPNIEENWQNGIAYQITEKDLGINKKNINTRDKLVQIYNLISNFKPVWMILQPSIAILLSELIINESLNRIDSLKYIELTGEMLYLEERNMIQETFLCNVANQYGMNETNSIAYECNNGKMHCMTSNVHVEIVRDNKVLSDGEEGEIVITSLKNKVMPFIRYRTGDRGRIFNKSVCTCGSKAPIIELTNGRCIDNVIHDDGRITDPYVFVDALEITNRLLGRIIKQFQIEQTDYENILIKLVILDDYDEEILFETIENNLCEEIVDDFNIYYKIYNYIFPDNINGKMSFYINKINKNH